MKIETVKKMVREILKDNAHTRGDDNILFLEVLKKLGLKINEITIDIFFQNYGRLDLPSIETVTRARRKAQEENPLLLPTDEVILRRRRAEEKFYNFALNC